MQRRARRVRDIVGTIATLLAATALGCASPRPEPRAAPVWDCATRAAAGALEAALAEAQPAPNGEVVVRLAFESGADLDLHVTDPLDETVYYGNTPVRSGGTLDADRRCADPAPRIETIRFRRPLAGRYRVGVDFQERCAGGVDVVPWAIAVEARGERRVFTGLAEWNAFASRVDEFVVD